MNSYTGLVATNCTNCNAYTASNAYFMSRSLHTAAVNILSLSLVFANWAITFTPSAEDIVGGTTATYTASIEYPIGVFTQVKFGGSVSGTAASGAKLTSDAVAISIPAGANFFVRNYRVHAAGSFNAPYTSWGSTLNQAAGDACTFGNSAAVTDQTMGGVIANTAPYIMAPPAAIIGSTTKPTYLLIGDSRVAGAGPLITGSQTATNPCVGELAPSFFNAGLGAISSGNPGGINFWVAGDFPLSATLAQYCSDVVSNHSIDDVTNNESAAQIVANHQAMMAGTFAGKQYWVCTIAPYTTSTDSWATLGNQTPFNAGFETVRLAYNAIVRNGLPGAYSYIDIAAKVESSLNSGKWKVTGAANYATGDGLHESFNGTALITASKIGLPISFGLLNIGGLGV